MKNPAGVSLTVAVLFSVTVLTQGQSLRDNDRIAAARLSAKELQQVVAALEESAYDTPDSWTEELRAKRVDLGGGNLGMVLQGTKLLCGGTGNCQLFVLRNVNGNWLSLFGSQRAPLAESFRFGPGLTHGIKDLTLTTNSSAEAGKTTRYRFDGQLYIATSSNAAAD